MDNVTEQFLRDLNRMLDKHDYAVPTIGYAIVCIQEGENESARVSEAAGGAAYVVANGLEDILDKVKEFMNE